MSGFCPDTKGMVEDTFFFFFLGSLVQSHCWEGGRNAAKNTGMCSQCLGHTGFAPTRGVCAFPVHTAQALGLLCQEPSKAGPGLHAPPRSKPLRFRHSGSPQRCRLSWACVLCPSQLQAAQVMISPPLSLPLSSLGVQPVQLLRRMTVQNPKKS